MTTGVAILGRAALLPGRAHDATTDPERPGEASLRVRTLGSELDRKPEGMARWSRLDRYGRALAQVATLAVARDRDVELATALVVASQRSCHETNAAFDQGLIAKGPRLASPFLFPYTLPGAAAAEIAMVLALGGPHLVFAGGPATALAGLVAAIDLLGAEHAPRALVLSADVLGTQTSTDLDGSRAPEEPPAAEAAAALWLGRVDDPAPGPRRQVAAVLGAAPASGAGVEALMRTALAAAEINAEDLAEVITTSSTLSRWDQEAAASTALAPDTPVLGLASRIGDAGAALGILAMQAALDDEGARLIYAAEPAAAVALVVQ